jgi:hypothetical protein
LGLARRLDRARVVANVFSAKYLDKAEVDSEGSLRRFELLGGCSKGLGVGDVG